MEGVPPSSCRGKVGDTVCKGQQLLSVMLEENNYVGSFYDLIFLGKSPIYTLKLLQKSDYRSTTTKPDNKSIHKCQNRNFLTLCGFKGVFKKKSN